MPASNPGSTAPKTIGSDMFRLLIESVKDYAIFMLSPEGRIMTWNVGAERIKGYRADEIVGSHFSRFYPTEAIAAKWPEHELQAAVREGRFEDEGWRVRKDRSMFWANVVITPLFDARGVHVGFAKITRDMTERKQAEALEEGRRQMSEFLAMLAHELRNPLAPIRNAIHVMAARDDERTRAWARGIIDRQVVQLTRLVDDFLDVTRITSGKIALKKAPMDLAEAVHAAVEAVRPMISARHHVLDIALGDEPVLVDGDHARLSQAILNLLINAAKYTPDGGRISCTLGREDGHAVVSVRDNGLGIPAELLPKVFELFMQVGRSLDRSEGGIGVGLTLVDRLVRLHDGTVTARSDGPGKGSEFVIRLPVTSQRRAVPAVPSGHDAPQPQMPRRVLIVEDNIDVAQTLGSAIHAWGHVVDLVHVGSAAVSTARQFKPDIVMLDIGLPGVNGYEIARRLRRTPGLEQVLLIATTGYGQEEDRQLSQAAGIHFHLVKPIDMELLAQVIAASQTVEADPQLGPG